MAKLSLRKSFDLARVIGRFENIMSIKFFNYATAISAIALSQSALSSTVSANDLTLDNEKPIETITVLGASGHKNAELGGISLRDLPLNVHVVGHTEIERIRFVDPDELLDRIPGETQVRNLRIPNGGKSYTLAFVDGVPVENPYEGATQRLDRVNTFDIERVEVIKGQTSALYPNNVFGGVVNVVTRDIPTQTQASISAEAGNFNRQRVGFNLGSYIGDNLGYSLNVNNRRLEGLREGSQNDRDVGSLKLAYQLYDNTFITARVEQLQETIEARGDLTAQEISDNPRQAGSLSSATDLEQDTASISLRHKLTSGELNFVALQRVKDSMGLSRFRGPQDENDEAINVNANYRHTLEQGSLIFGLDTYRGDIATKSFDRSDTKRVGPFTQSNSQFDITAYFGQYQLELLSNLTLTAGLRYENISLSEESDNHNKEFSDLAPKLGINYRISNDVQIWASISDGFYAPDLDDLFDVDNGNPNLNPEEAHNMEFGFRGTWANWAYDTSVYHNQIKNYLVTQELVSANGDEFELTTNSGQVTVKGVESVIEYAQADANWRIGLTHTYANNTYDSFVQSTPGAADDFSGNQISRSPKHHLNARIAWEPISNVTAELEGDFYSSYFSDDANSAAGKFTRDERLNLRVTYVQERWRLWVNVLNMTNTLEDRASFSRDSLKFRTIDGRSYYAGVSYNF